MNKTNKTITLKVLNILAIDKHRWFTVRSSAPKGICPHQETKFPKYVTGSFEIATNHLLNRIVAEENPKLSVYGFDGFNWNKLS